jgi:hypothetical protein
MIDATPASATASVSRRMTSARARAPGVQAEDGVEEGDRDDCRQLDSELVSAARAGSRNRSTALQRTTMSLRTRPARSASGYAVARSSA